MRIIEGGKKMDAIPGEHSNWFEWDSKMQVSIKEIYGNLSR